MEFKDVVREILQELNTVKFIQRPSGVPYAVGYNLTPEEALSALLKEIDKRIGKNRKTSFLDDVYCSSCRLSEKFCQCKGFNEAKAEVRKAMGL